MAGYYALKDSQEIDLLSQKFHGGFAFDETKVKYHRYNDKIVILTPIASDRWPAFMQNLQQRYLDKHKEKLEDFHIIMSFKGQAISEEHIVAAYFPPHNNTPKLFDSKTVDLQAFFNPAGSSFFTRAWNALQIKNGSQFAQKYQEYGKEEIKQQAFEYYTLGTQSLFDGVTCGMHCAQNMMAIFDLLKDAEEVTLSNVVAKVRKPVDAAQKQLKIPTAYSDFLKQAWQDTFMLDQDDSQRKTQQFKHYFLGWPEEPGTRDVLIYAFTGQFLLKPLLNSVKIITLFPANALAQSVNYLKNRLLAWSPTNSYIQYLRSSLLLGATVLHGITKIPALLLQTILSPVASFKLAWKTPPAHNVTNAEKQPPSGGNPYNSDKLARSLSIESFVDVDMKPESIKRKTQKNDKNSLDDSFEFLGDEENSFQKSIK